MPPVLSVVIPAYNEAARLPRTLTDIRHYLDSSVEDYEVIVVDDGSFDGTAQLAKKLAEDWPQLQVMRLQRNSGKGAAVRAGMLQASGTQRLFTDADLSTPIEELGALQERLHDDCQVVIASRALPASRIEEHQPRRREWMGRMYNLILRTLLLRGIHDSQCGFKLFTADAAQTCFAPLRTMRYGFDAEVLLRARRQGWCVEEVPVRWRHVEDSRVSSIRDASRMLIDLALLRFRRL